MASMANRRSIMTLYSSPNCEYCHRVRIVLAEKGVSVDILTVNDHDMPQDLAELNPYNTVPTLLDRDLVLYQSPIIMEYLDERFPHPPLMPVYPVARAEARRMMFRIEKDWYSLIKVINRGESEAEKADARGKLRNILLAIAPIFKEKPFFLSDEFGLMDCYLAPILWRLPQYGIELPSKAKPVLTYAEKVFERDAFQASLSEVERELRSTV